MAGIQRDAAGREVYASDLPDQMNALLASKADVSAIPQAASIMPQPEAVGASIGTAGRYATQDHQHPRLTSTTYATLDANGRATVTFSRTFASKPGVVLTETDSTNNQPLVLKVESFTQTNNLYSGCVVRGYRAQVMPTINPLSPTLTLVAQVITAVNAVIAQITGYNVFAGSAAGVTVSVIGVARSDVPNN